MHIVILFLGGLLLLYGDDLYLLQELTNRLFRAMGQLNNPPLDGSYLTSWISILCKKGFEVTYPLERSLVRLQLFDIYCMVGATYPSEKLWTSSVGVMKLPIYGKIKAMFQTTNQNIYIYIYIRCLNRTSSNEMGHLYSKLLVINRCYRLPG